MIEKKLRETPLMAPSAALDNKIHELIDDSFLNQRGLFRQPVPLWGSAAACAAFALLGFFVSQWTGTVQSQPEPEQVHIYIMEPNEALRDLLLRGKTKTDQNFFQTKKSDIQIITPQNVSAESGRSEGEL